MKDEGESCSDCFVVIPLYVSPQATGHRELAGELGMIEQQCEQLSHGG